ncbi:annexin D5 [Nymphaea colorata]|nr:annexin D5 [Nymphaea colorata]
MATLTVPPAPTSPQQDAIELYRAFKGFGCDSAAIVNILAHRDAAQRGLIQQEYHKMYTDDLMRRLSSELSGDLKKAVLLWMPDPAGRDATIIRQALTGDTIDIDVATEIICSRTPSQIHFLKYAYHGKFGTYLEHEIGCLASGDHKKLLLAYLSTGRYEGPEVDLAMAEMDAKALYKAGEKRLGTDESTFIQIFSGRSRAHLAAVASSYHHLYRKKLKKVVKSETSGKFEDALLTILTCAENPARYFAKGLYKAMKGLGTNDTKLIRIVVTRAEIDMQYIKAEYQSKYKKPLSDAVHSETSGQYRAFLLALIGGKH